MTNEQIENSLDKQVNENAQNKEFDKLNRIITDIKEAKAEQNLFNSLNPIDLTNIPATPIEEIIKLNKETLKEKLLKEWEAVDCPMSGIEYDSLFCNGNFN